MKTNWNKLSNSLGNTVTCHFKGRRTHADALTMDTFKTGRASAGGRIFTKTYPNPIGYHTNGAAQHTVRVSNNTKIQIHGTPWFP